jgi:hypothetical protein
MAYNPIIDIYNDCLEMLQRGETIERCLAAYPQHAGELELLLRASMAVASARPTPDPAFRAAARLRFQGAVRHHLAQQQQAAARQTTVGGRGFWRGGFTFTSLTRAWAGMAAALVLTVGLTGGVAFASSDAMPDSPLYGVKRLTERARLAMISSELERALFNLELANRRAKEAAVMAETGNASKVEELIQDINRYIEVAQAEGGLELGMEASTGGATLLSRDAAGAATAVGPTAADASNDASIRAAGAEAAPSSQEGTSLNDGPRGNDTSRFVALDADDIADPDARKLIDAIFETVNVSLARLTLAQQDADESAKDALDRAVDNVSSQYANISDAESRVLVLRGVVSWRGDQLWVADRLIDISRLEGDVRLRDGQIVEVGGALKSDDSMLAVQVKPFERRAQARGEVTIQALVLSVSEDGFHIPGYYVKRSRETKWDNAIQQGHWVWVDGLVTAAGQTILAQRVQALNGAPRRLADD